MPQEIAISIPLEQVPNPEGDNRFEVKINEGSAWLTYFASKMVDNCLVNFGNVTLLFSNCVASKYVGSEPDDELYPGWYEVESDFCEINNSQWAASFMNQDVNYHHYVFCLNHQVFECIAESYSSSSEKDS